MIFLEREIPKPEGHHKFISPTREGIAKMTGTNMYRHNTLRLKNVRPVLIYPSLGNAGVGIEYATDVLDIPTITRLKRQKNSKRDSESNSTPRIDSLYLPRPFTRSDVAEGLKTAPDNICTPFVYESGYLQNEARAMEELRLVDGVLYYGEHTFHKSRGVCKEREYGVFLELALDLLYNGELHTDDFDFYLIEESPEGLLKFIGHLQHLRGKAVVDESVEETIYALNGAITRIDAIEAFEEKVRLAQSCGVEINATEALLREARETLVKSKVLTEELPDLMQFYYNQLEALRNPKEHTRPRIGTVVVVGEIFQMEEARAASFDAFGKLARMGVIPYKFGGLREYTKRFRFELKRLIQHYFDSIVKGVNPFYEDPIRGEAARGGLTHDPGGHGVDTVYVPQAIEKGILKVEGYNGELLTPDGYVVLTPYNCLPEITAQNVNTHLHPDIRCLYLPIQLHEAAAGADTRFEAFVDTIGFHKRQSMRLVAVN